jgi:hypothetical protein
MQEYGEHGLAVHISRNGCALLCLPGFGSSIRIRCYKLNAENQAMVPLYVQIRDNYWAIIPVSWYDIAMAWKLSRTFPLSEPHEKVLLEVPCSPNNPCGPSQPPISEQQNSIIDQVSHSKSLRQARGGQHDIEHKMSLRENVLREKQRDPDILLTNIAVQQEDQNSITDEDGQAPLGNTEENECSGTYCASDVQMPSKAVRFACSLCKRSFARRCHLLRYERMVGCT